LRTLSAEERQRTADWIAGRQGADGSLPWFPGRKLDPWDHIQSAMSLALAGRREEAHEAFRFLARTQDELGAWPSAGTAAVVFDSARETNHAAYLASGLWYMHLLRPETEFLREMWPCLERAIEYVVSLQDAESGVVMWATSGDGVPHDSPLLTGCSSVHGSLVCAERIAVHLGHERPHWGDTRRRLAAAIRADHPLFRVQKTERFSMDWYYPVLGGVIRGDAALVRFQKCREMFIGEGMGCRCVEERPWYTVAETCELVIALEICGLTRQARSLFEWTHSLREEDGGYWTGMTYPDLLKYPPERPTWTAATVLLAADVLDGTKTPTSRFFRSLEAEAPARRQAG
jgi:hypothetical protein